MDVEMFVSIQNIKVLKCKKKKNASCNSNGFQTRVPKLLAFAETGCSVS